MSSKPKVTRTASNTESKVDTTTNRTPWEPASQYFPDLYASGADALAATNNNLYSGDYIAAPTGGQRSSVDQIYAAAPDLATGATDLRALASRIASGEFLDPSNPLLTQAIAAVNDPVKLNLQNQILPGITDAAVRGGAYGGTGNTLLNTQAISDYERNAMNTGSKMQLDWFNQRFGDIFNTPSLFQGANTLALAPAVATGAAGETERGLNQLGLDNALAQYQNELTAPWFGLSDFANLLNAGGYGTSNTQGTTTGTQSGTVTQPAPDMATQLLQGGLGGLSTLSSLGTAFPETMGSLGGLFGLGGAGATAAGASAGGISAMLPILAGLSDRRFKEDITKIGTADNGLPIYRFRFVGHPNYCIGFMADEVEKLKPNAVYEKSGIKYVDYRRATEI